MSVGPAGDALERRVGPEEAGRRLDVLLAGPCGSRAAAQRAIAAGAVAVDGRTAGKSHVVRDGEHVVVAATDRPTVATGSGPPAVAAAPAVRVRHADPHLLVVEKPAGLLVHAGAGEHGATLVDVLAAREDLRPAGGGDPTRPGIVHRLDRDTSGLLLVARSEAVHRDLQRAVAAREVVREYLALVEGRPQSRTGTIDAPLGRDPHVRTRRAVGGLGARAAVTDFAIEEALAGATLLRVRLRTGRTHQIRVHLAAIGLPVCGDPVYGREGGAGPDHRLDRQFLHAARLALTHPVTGEPLEVHSPLPGDLAAALERLRPPAGPEADGPAADPGPVAD